MARSRKRVPVYWIVVSSNRSREPYKRAYHRAFRRISASRIAAGVDPLFRLEEVSDWTWDIKEGRVWSRCRCGEDTWYAARFGGGLCHHCHAAGRFMRK